ncbi:hypothetical protein Q5H93_05010 [Hymenobacter sp. ASUV-10]|uniref:Uncharacterized protein n=1 Tax=Hymenobacter aranciens TaxID=3063996 RepID=A0ABT9B7A7_9BACT|nr:hypothetical protein [Hymenobacter sp. ASUV-10]MDO7874083.1 hypothetical protein [Hymenobacter sp. ASUV-10]
MKPAPASSLPPPLPSQTHQQRLSARVWSLFLLLLLTVLLLARF